MAEPVLLRRSSLGDVVLLGAVTGAVPGGVTVVTAPEWAPVAARLVGVNRVVSWPRDVPLAELRRALGPGPLFDLHGSLRSLRLAPGARRIRKHGLIRRLRLLGLPLRRPSVTDLYARTLGVEPVAAPWIRLPEAERDALVLLPGARTAMKRWGGFSALRWPGPVVVLGGPEERELCAQAAPPGAEVVTEGGFAATFRVLARARVAVGNDSGLLHLAAACGVPVVAVFTCTHPDDGFFVHAGEVVQVDLGCRPCTLHGRARCPLGHGRCRDVAVSAVQAALERQCAGSC